MHSKNLNLSVSLDGKVEEILDVSRDYIEVNIRVPFQHEILLDYFKEALSEGTVFADLRARAARLGFDLETLVDADTDKQKNGNSAFSIDDSSIIYRAKIFPYMDDFLPRDGDWQRTLGYEGWNPGKLVAILDDDFVNQEELRISLMNDQVRLPKGSVLNEDSVMLSLNQKRYEPRMEKTNVLSLTQALDNLEREELGQFQRQVGSDLVVPSDGGLVTHTSLRSDSYSLLIAHDQKNGIRNTQALHVNPHSSVDLYLGLKGNSKSDTPIESVKVHFLKNPVHKLRSNVMIPDLKLADRVRTTEEHYNPKYTVHIHVPSYLSGKGNLIKIGDIDPDSPSDLRMLGKYIRNKKGGNLNIYFRTFPPQNIINQLISAETSENISSLVFSRPSILEESFSNTDYWDMKNLRKNDIEVIWDHPILDRLFFHRIGFMKASETDIFDQAYSSNSIFAAFGSAAYASEADKKNMNDATIGVSRFLGRFGYIVNGGGPAAMNESTNAAREAGLRVITVSLSIAQEQQQDSYRHIIIPFGGRHINIRQGIMTNYAGGGYLIYDGGSGTAFETFEAITKSIIEARNRPILLIGDSPVQQKVADLVDEHVRSGRLSSDIYRNFRHLPDGKQVYNALMDHYNLDDAVNFL